MRLGFRKVVRTSEDEGGSSLNMILNEHDPGIHTYTG